MARKQQRRIKATKKAKKVDKPFGDGTMTNSGFFGYIRSALRNRSRFFKPISNCRLRNRVKYTGSNKRRKWMYICEECKQQYDIKGVQVHHNPEVGSLKSFEDLPRFVEVLFCNSDKLRLLCTKCHDNHHHK